MDLSTRIRRIRVSHEAYDAFEWEKWTKEIPYINFPERFEVKIIPPFTGAVIRFLVRDKEYPSVNVSVYLDCYEILGIYGSPYWEIYPYIDGDTYRCGINEIDELLQVITKSIDKQITREK